MAGVQLRVSHASGGPRIRIGETWWSLTAAQASTLADALASRDGDATVALSPAPEGTRTPPRAMEPTRAPAGASWMPAGTDAGASHPELPDLTVETMRFLPAAEEWAGRLGVDRARILRIWDDPTDEWVAASRTGTAIVVTDDEIGVTVGLDHQTILSVTTRKRALRSKPPEPGRQPGIPRGHGGVGTRYPTTQRELLQRARAAGADVHDLSGGHIRVSKDGRSYTIPATGSDYRGLMNGAKGIERELGIDLRRG